MNNWVTLLSVNPLEKLLSSNDKILTSFVKRDLLDENSPVNIDNKEIQQIIKKQLPNGAWKFKSQSVSKYPSINHDLVETFKSLRILVGKYELDKSHPTISKCADYIFTCQAEEGDIRGILGNQYMPYYCGAIVELLIKAGYEKDDRVEKAIKWLISNQQNDGGWVVPLQTVKVDKLNDLTYASSPIIADKTLPSSHLATGMVIRGLAAHSVYKKKEPSKKAAKLLKSRFLQSDKYNDRKTPEYWTKFQYPYWCTTLLSSLDSLYQIGYTTKDKDVEKGLEWLLVNQHPSGFWSSQYDKGNRDKLELDKLWIGYNICKILKWYFK